RAERTAFDKFAADTVFAIRDEAYVLVAMTERDVHPHIRTHADMLVGQARLLKEAIALFEKNVVGSKFGTYEVQLWVFRLETEIRDNLRYLEKELGWLTGKTVTETVMQNALGDLRYASDKICLACVGATRELGFEKSVPTDEAIELRVKQS